MYVRKYILMQQVIIFQMLFLLLISSGKKKAAVYIQPYLDIQVQVMFMIRVCQVLSHRQTANGNRHSQREPITASLSSTANTEKIICSPTCLNYFHVAKCCEAWDAIPQHHLSHWARRNARRPFEIHSGRARCTNTHCWQKAPPFKTSWCSR